MKTCKGELLGDWRIIAACFAGLMLAVGTIVTYTAGIFSVAIVREFGWTQADFAFALMFFYYSLVPGSVICGELVDRLGPRRLILASTLCLALGLIGLCILPASLALFCIAYAAIGLVSIGTLPVTYARVIARRFDLSRGTALGITMTGVGVGGAILPALGQYLIDQWGWRVALGAIACTVLLFGMTGAARYIPNEPTSKGQSSNHSSAFRQAWSESRAALLGLGAISLFCGIVLTGLVVNMAPLAASKGLGHSGIAAAGATMGVAIIAGRLGIGILMDRFPANAVLGIFLLAPAIGALILGWTSGGPALFVAAILVGLAQGAEVDAVAYLVSRQFSPEKFGTIYGIMFALFTAGAANGPLLFAKLQIVFGSFAPGLGLFACITGVCALLCFQLPKHMNTSRPAPA